MKRKQWLILIVGGLLGITLAACSNRTAPPEEGLPSGTPQRPLEAGNEEAEQSAGADATLPAAPTVDWDAVLPVYSIVVGDREIQGVRGGFCWPVESSGPNRAVSCTSIIPPTFDTYTLLPAGEPIHVRLADPLPAKVTISLQQGELQQVVKQLNIVAPEADIRWEPVIDPGDYVLVVYAQWPEDAADIAYYFGVTIPPPPDSTPTP